MFILRKYRSNGLVNRGFGKYSRMSLYHGIPVDQLEVAKTVLANLYPQVKFRIRYRGKRAGYRDGRSRTQHQQDCLKAYAETFAIYYR
jgi:hypothetical protein